MELKRGMLVKSKAGRDKDCIYVIGDVSEKIRKVIRNLESSEGPRPQVRED